MPTKPMTTKQRHWLKQVKAADASSGTLSDYASEQGLKPKALYQWKTKLIKLGHYRPSLPKPGFVTVRSQPLGRPHQNGCSITLGNGSRIEFTGVLDSSTIRTIISSAGLRR